LIIRNFPNALNMNFPEMPGPDDPNFKHVFYFVQK
jgi:hypothetical protein